MRFPYYIYYFLQNQVFYMRPKIKLVLILLLAALVSWWLVPSFFADSKGKNNIAAVKVSTAPAVRKDVPVTLSLVGNVIAYETVPIKSRIDSQIMEVKFHDGDLVKKGQVLFVLDDRSLLAQFAQEQAKLTNAKIQYERAQKLLAGKYIAQANADDSKSTYDAALASVENTRVLLSYTKIEAPIGGRVGTINVTQGNNVKANDSTPLVTVNQISPIRAEFSIPERYYEKVKNAISSIPVTALRQNGTTETANNNIGKLEYIDNQIDQKTGSFIARARFANENEALWPGMFVNIILDLGAEKNMLTIPASAVQGDEGKHFIFKVIENKAVKTPIEVRISGDDAIIDKGINESEIIITDGLLRVADGIAIEDAGK